MSARVQVPCAVNAADSMTVEVFPDGAFEFTVTQRGATTRVVLNRETYVRMCVFGLDALMKKVGGT